MRVRPVPQRSQSSAWHKRSCALSSDASTGPAGQSGLAYVPDLARLSGGPWRPIAAFSTDHAVVLALSLSHDPATNRLYKMVKGNILPMGGMLAAKAARAAGQAATDATRTVTEAPQRARTWVEQLEQEIYRQYGVPR
jgi:hypothetical protein